MAKLNFEKVKDNKGLKRISSKANGLLLALLMCTDQRGNGSPKWRTLGSLARMSNFQTFDKYLSELKAYGLVDVKKEKGFILGIDKKIPVSKTIYQINPNVVLSVNEAKGETSTNQGYFDSDKGEKVENKPLYRGFSPTHEDELSVIGTKTVNISNKENIRKIRVTREGNNDTQNSIVINDSLSSPLSTTAESDSNNLISRTEDTAVEEYERLRQEWFKKDFPSMDNVTPVESVVVSESTDDIPF